MIGIVMREPSSARTLDLIVEAEDAGVPAAWLTTAGAGRDGLTLLAAAATKTSRIKLGTSIIPTWPRHPIVVAQQAQVVEALAPGRLRIGVGPASRDSMQQLIGARWRTPLRHLREYVIVLKTLLQTGAVDFEGEHFTAHARITSPINVPVLGSALLPGAFRACGEVADGVISWMAPQRYIEAQALPALREGAIQAGRKTPPLYYHVPVCVTTDREQAFAAAREQVGTYANLPTYAAMFEAAGHESKGGLDEAYYGEYLIYGAKEEVARQLREGLNQSAAEVIAHPVLVGDRDASLRDIFSAIATANQ